MFIKQIKVKNTDKTVPFWEFEQYFKDDQSVLNMTEDHKQYIVNEFGIDTLVQGFLRAKVTTFILCFIIYPFYYRWRTSLDIRAAWGNCPDLGMHQQQFIMAISLLVMSIMQLRKRVPLCISRAQNDLDWGSDFYI